MAVLTRTGERRIWEYDNTLRTEGIASPIVRGLAHDVTERVLAEGSLRAAEERLRLALEVAKIGTFERNLQTGESRWSPEMEAMFGLLPGGMPKTIEAFLALVHAKDRAYVANLLEHSNQTGYAEGEWRVVWPDSTEHWITGRWRVFKDEHGRPLRVVGADFDVTERKRADQLLRESETNYRTLFDSMDEGFCTIEVLFDENNKAVDYVFLEVNPVFEKLTGISNAQGRTMREIAPQHEEYWFETYGKIALTGEPARFENLAAQLHRWYEVHAFRVGAAQERKVAIFFDDITER